MQTIRKPIPINYKTGNLRLRYHLCRFRVYLNRAILIVGIIILFSGITSCVNKADNDHKGEEQMSAKTIENVLKEHTEELMSLPGVVGTAQGLSNNKPCIKIFVIEKTPELDREIPDNLEGYQVIIEESGEIRALPKK